MFIAEYLVTKYVKVIQDNTIGHCNTICVSHKTITKLHTMSSDDRSNDSQNWDNLSSNKQRWSEDKTVLKCSTPSVIRKGLCMVRDKGNSLLYLKDYLIQLI